MSIGVLIFMLVAVPVLIFLRSLRRVQRSLDDPASRRFAIVETSLIIFLTPLLVATAMLVEAQIDPDFARRSFDQVDLLGLDVLRFSYDQAIRGALFDFAEVFKISISPMDYKCESLLFCSSLFLYRSTMGIAATSLILAVLLSVRSVFTRHS